MAYNTTAAIDSGRVHFHLVRFKFAMLYPSMRSASGALLWLAGLQALSDRPALLQYRSRQTARNLGLWLQFRESDGGCGDESRNGRTFTLSIDAGDKS
jgi:hypothetical protein